MPNFCCVPSCNNEGNPYSFHKFPDCKNLRVKWLHAIRRDPGRNFTVTKHTRVCSAHFLPSDFKTTLLGERRRLIPSSVPKIFPWTKEEKDHIEKRAARLKNRRKTRGSDKAYVYHEPNPHLETVDEHSSEDVLISNDLQCTNVELQTVCRKNACQSVCMCVSVASSANHSINQGKEFKDFGIQTFEHKGLLNIDGVLKNPAAVQLYTGLDDYCHFNLVFSALGKARYHLENFPLCPEHCFLLTLIKLRNNKTYKELAILFGINSTTVGRIFCVWINFMYCQFNELDIFPDKNIVTLNMPEGIKSQYPSTRVIVDATEVPIIKPNNPIAQQLTFSSYKNTNTVKVLIGIAPSGLVSYISPAFGGSASDRQIFEISELLAKLEEGDSVMADRGFNVQDLLCEKKVLLNIPPFLGGKSQLSPEENIKGRRIASQRIHVERAIGLAKTYKILQNRMNFSNVTLASRIIYVCFMLANFRRRYI